MIIQGNRENTEVPSPTFWFSVVLDKRVLTY